MPEMGVAGAAVGSALAIILQASFWVFLLFRYDRSALLVSGWRQGTFKATLARHFRFSLPIAATFISATLAAHVCSLIYAKMALTGFAALTLIAPWSMLAGQISMQWTQATGIIIAQLLGQNTSSPFCWSSSSHAQQTQSAGTPCVQLAIRSM